jgi:uncharacterized protein (TIGR03000 family)
MKRQWLYCVFASLSLVVCGTIYQANAGRGSGRSPQYAVGRTPAATAIVQGADEYAYGATANDAVEMILKVPSAAELWFNGTKTAQQAKAVRHFVTPALDPGQDYSYDIRVRWTDDGQPVEQTRRVLVRAGDRMTLNLMDLPKQANSAATKR